MLIETMYTEGKNEFDNVFSSSEWSAPYMISPEEIRERISSLNLEGRKIKRIKIIGLAYNLTRDWIEERAYTYLQDESFTEEERHHRSEYKNINLKTEFARFARIDEPLLIEFEDEDIFEIDTPQVPEFRIGMNCIPMWVGAGTNDNNIDANILFKPCIGREIVSVEINTYVTDKDPMLNAFFDEAHSEKELVSDVILWLDNNLGICVEGWIDFCHVSLIDREGRIDTIAFDELKDGLFNWEDIHTDPVSGYRACHNSFLFGKKGAKRASRPYITLTPEEKGERLHIYIYDFLLFDWSIAIFTKGGFDEYGEYSFSKKEWGEILKIADKLTSFASFDELFDYMKTIDMTRYDILKREEYSVMLNLINLHGAEFWKHLEKYRLQLTDMKNWSELVLTDSGKMRVFGF